MDQNKEFLREIAFAGLKELGFDSRAEYVDRLEMELGVVEELGFCPYFLVMWDIVQFARKNKILSGPGRGSAAGSLLCYCLKITLINPIQYDLSFERFLNLDRIPDIDWDTAQRAEIIEYLETRYGKDRVARVGSLNFLRTRSAVNDIGRVLGKESYLVKELANLVPPPVAGLWESFDSECEVEPKLLDEKYIDIIEPVKKLWGVVRSYGTHAGGVAISPVPINKIIPLYKDKSGNPVSQFDWRDLESAGLLKFDILGLATLEVIQLCLKYVSESSIEIELESLEDGDKDSYDLICSGDLDGIFQLGGSESTKQLTVQIAPRSIEDLSLVNALGRPGPMSSGLLDEAIAIRNGKKEATYIHPILETILEPTHSIPIYQEQVSKICVDLCGYTPLEGNKMIKILGKKLQDKMKEEKPKFINGAVNTGVSRDNAQQLFGQLENYAQYLFNKCLTGDTEVIEHRDWIGSISTTINGIKNSLDKGHVVKLLSFDPVRKECQIDQCTEVINTGTQEVWKVTSSNGATVFCTLDHKFLCSDKRKHPVYEIIIDELSVISLGYKTAKYSKKIKFISAERYGLQQTYNLCMKHEPHNFVLANGLISGNSHSIAYSTITYWTAYLKAHYPLEFYSALLAKETKPDRIIQYSSSIRDAGIEILPPDINCSDVFHRPEGNAIRFGLSHIKGLGIPAAEKIIRAREEEDEI
jgi:DNA polymerase III alpha subunit